MVKVDLIATLTAPPSPSGAELSALSSSVGSLEIRADLVGDLNPEWLRANFKGQLIYALRSKDAGGESLDSPSERQRRFQKAVPYYDRIELEANKDCSPKLLEEISAGQRLISWYGPAGDLSELKARFAQLSSVPAATYKLICRSERISDEFTSLSLLKSLSRSDTIAYAEGPMGFWSRLVALHLGAPAIYGAMSNGALVPGEPTINKLIDDYALPELRPIKEIFAIIGSPVFHSLSPRLHNAAYHEMKYPGLFLPLRVESFDEFWEAVVRSRVFDTLGFSLNGMTVASPHKEAALRTANSVSPMARQAESANILVRNNGYWSADTTDPEVIYMASRERNVKVDRKRAAVIGCGGAGRAIAAALVQSGAGVTLVNRGAERGSHAAELLSLPYLPLPNFDAEGYDIVVNATPVGRDTDEVPFQVDRLSDDAVVIDLVYGTRPTSLVGSTLGREQIVIDGRDVLLTQVHRQFQMMTGKDMSPIVAPETLRRTTTVATADVAQTVGLPSS